MCDDFVVVDDVSTTLCVDNITGGDFVPFLSVSASDRLFPLMM